MQAHRYGEMLRPLKAMLETLLQLEAADLDGALLMLLANAYAKAAEHHYLLTILKPRPGPPKAGAPPEPPFKGFRFGQSAG